MYAVVVREVRPAGAVLVSHALLNHYATLEAAARVGRSEARRQARRRSCPVEFKVLDTEGRLATGGVVPAAA